MQGRTPTKPQREFHNALAGLGCVACRQEGKVNKAVSIHHIEGRTKFEAHWLVLPLCASHHQDDGTKVAVHPFRARFEQLYGTQYTLLAKCVTLLKKRDHSREMDETLQIVDSYVQARQDTPAHGSSKVLPR